MNTDRLDHLKTYCMVVIIFIFVGELILGAGLYQEYDNNGSVSDTLFRIWILFLAVEILLIITYCFLRAYLKRKLGASYIGASHMGKTAKNMLFHDKQSFGYMESEAFKEAVKGCALWKKMSSGVNVKYIFYFIFCFGSGSLFLWFGFYEKGVLALVLGLLFGIICYFWAVVNFCAIRKKADALLQYVEEKGISFDALNQDFLCAMRLGSQMWLGHTYFFIYTSTGAQVMALSDIERCKVHWMGSFQHLPYFVLEVQGDNKSLMKYGVFPFAFYKVKKQIERGKPEGFGEDYEGIHKND